MDRRSPRRISPFTVGVTIGIASLMCLGPLLGGTTGGASATGALSSSGMPPSPAALHAADRSRAVPTTNDGPHPGTLEIWEDSSGGPETVDPSICYYTVCDEPISNVYETLVAYNGSDDGPTPSNFVPELATCVPGSLECATQFGGSDLVWANNSTGAPEYYTFEIDAGARFYDSVTGTSWPVYPSDVVFTFARTMGFADLEYEEQTNGWINAQDLLPAGNPSWDAGIHAPLNNTPQHILSAFLVNDSAYCPASVTVATNGCVTFNLTASGHAWPFFLELVADNMGASVEPCGWYTFQGASVPGFLGTNASNGDGPCLLPGNTTNTSQAGFQDYIRAVGPEGWDGFEEEADNWPADQPSVQWSDVGSGPYYIDNPVSPSSGYTLAANPDYAAPVGCGGQPGCLPDPGSYIPNVDVAWEAGCALIPLCDVGLTEMEAGQADSAGFYPMETGQILDLPDYHLLSGIPSLTIGFFPMALTFNVSNEETLDQTGQLNVPGNFLDNDALRQFLVNAYPYRTIDSTFDEVNNTLFGEPYGGAIPHNMGDYYPTNISWPSGDPVSGPSTVGNVTWWWAQANDPSSPLYDPELASCTSSSPCRWATFSVQGATSLDDEMNLWNGEVANLSGGNLTPYLVDQSGNMLISELGSPPGQIPTPVYYFGWAPDYPDPSDYMAPMYYPDNSYTWPDAVSETLEANRAFSAADGTNSSSCPNDYGAWSNLTYWAGISAIPVDCQGAAYDTMVAFMNQAQFDASVPQRSVEYNLVEQIADKLALYVYDPQSLAYIDYGDWIEPTTINTNPMYGGEGVQLWFDWSYVSNFFNATFLEDGLSNGTTWTVTVDGTQYSSGGSSEVIVPALTNGTFHFVVGGELGFTVNPMSGDFNITGKNSVVEVTFDNGGGPFVLEFMESGLPVGSAWAVELTAEPNDTTTTFAGDGNILAAYVAGGNYSYTAGAVVDFVAPPTGSVDLTSGPTTIPLVYRPLYPIVFQETGLTANETWSVTLGDQFLQTSSAQLSFAEPNGSYAYVVHPVRGETLAPAAGNVSVSGAAVSVPLDFFAVPVWYSLTVTERGLPSGTSWSLTLDGMKESSTGPTLVFSVGNGTYGFTVSPVSGYSTTTAGGSVTLDGLNRTMIVNFVPNPTSTGFLGLGTNDWAVAILAGVLAVGAIAAGRRIRSKEPPPPEVKPNTPGPPGTIQKVQGLSGAAEEQTDADRWRPPP